MKNYLSNRQNLEWQTKIYDSKIFVIYIESNLTRNFDGSTLRRRATRWEKVLGFSAFFWHEIRTGIAFS